MWLLPQVIFRLRGAVVGERTQADADARQSGERAHAAHQHHRAVEALVLAPARGEVGDLHRAAVAVAQDGAQHGGVAQVMLFGATRSLPARSRSRRRLRRETAGRRRWDRHRTRARSPTRRGRGHRAGRRCCRCRSMPRSRLVGAVAWVMAVEVIRGSRGSLTGQRVVQPGAHLPPDRAGAYVAALGRRPPTSTLMPPCALTATKPSSSVRSSPMNTGRRPGTAATSSSAAPPRPCGCRPGAVRGRRCRVSRR